MSLHFLLFLSIIILCISFLPLLAFFPHWSKIYMNSYFFRSLWTSLIHFHKLIYCFINLTIYFLKFFLTKQIYQKKCIYNLVRRFFMIYWHLIIVSQCHKLGNSRMKKKWTIRYLITVIWEHMQSLLCLGFILRYLCYILL